MLRVFETFSGIGSQAKALKAANIEHQIIATADWDVAAIIAYDLIHHGKPSGDEDNIPIEVVDEELNKHTFSLTGKAPSTPEAIKKLSNATKRRLYGALKRSNNLVSMTDIKGEDIPADIDLLTYSFPCQDLSLCKFWHGDVRGIERDAHTRSGMLWEVERILKEMQSSGKSLPRFLLMENVCAILNSLNKKDFDEWKSILNEFGYDNFIYRLNARNFGIPQNRERAYMISVRTDSSPELSLAAHQLLYGIDDLREAAVVEAFKQRDISLSEILRLDYSDPVLRREADESQPNDTESRRKIYETNTHLVDRDGKPINLVVNTVTTKQDRHPNSGVIAYQGRIGGACYRNLTPRECFMLMGFDEADYEIIIDNNVPKDAKSMLFSRDKLIKLAGNSIVVDVLIAIFKVIDETNNLLWPCNAEENPD